jgi:hypothetical protein
MLTVDAGNTKAVGAIQAAIGELERVLDRASSDRKNPQVTSALEDLLSAAHSATRNPLDDGLLDRLTTRLATLGERVQPLCEFPT